MNFQQLVDALRRKLQQSIDDGKRTGLGIARDVQVKQAHISNFLHEKRGVSFDLADQLLETLDLEIENLIAEKNVADREPVQNADSNGAVEVPVVGGADALRAVIEKRRVRATLFVSADMVKRSRSSQRKHWLRLIAIEGDAGEFLVIDRHSLNPGEGTFVIASGAKAISGRLATVGTSVVFCPDNASHGLQRDPDVVGRVIQTQTVPCFESMPALS